MFLTVTCLHASGACQSHSRPVLSLPETSRKYVELSHSTPPFLTLQFHMKNLTLTPNLLQIRPILPPLGHILSPQHGTWTAIRLSKAAHEHISAIHFFTTIVTIAIILAIDGWPNNQDLTSVLDSTIALRRIWYVSSELQEKASSRSCKTPHNHHHFHYHHHHFCPSCRHRKKLTLIAPPNNDKCPGGQIFPLNRTSHRHNTRPRNRCP
jgi:hypothetical protein